jgi:hypothetical protein
LELLKMAQDRLAEILQTSKDQVPWGTTTSLRLGVDSFA